MHISFFAALLKTLFCGGGWPCGFNDAAYAAGQGKSS